MFSTAIHPGRATSMVALLGGLVLVASTSTALAGSNPARVRSNSKITACFSRSTGALRVVPSGHACHRNEQSLVWNKRGRRGPAGAAGTVGAAGSAGPTGSAGAKGPRGATGALGVAGAPGPLGPRGVAGSPGTPGPSGPAGAVGPKGSPGTPGPAGARGPAGPAVGTVKIEYLTRTIRIPATNTGSQDYRAECPSGDHVLNGVVRSVSRNFSYSLGTGYADDRAASSAWIVQLQYSPISPLSPPPGRLPATPTPPQDGTAVVQIICAQS